MTFEELKKKYGGRSDKVDDTCCKTGPTIINGNATCLCTAIELKEGNFYMYCRKHGDKEKLAERERALEQTFKDAEERRKKRMSYPPLLPPSSQEAKLPGEQVIHKPHPDGGVITVRKFRPDSHLGGTEAVSTEVDWYGDGYEYGI